MSTAAKELPACPVETTLTLISDKWKVLILRDLMPGTKRFGELKKSIGTVSQKVLTAQLRQMEESGLLTRKVYPEVPPRVEYTLTELGSIVENVGVMGAPVPGFLTRIIAALHDSVEDAGDALTGEKKE